MNENAYSGIKALKKTCLALAQWRNKMLWGQPLTVILPWVREDWNNSCKNTGQGRAAKIIFKGEKTPQNSGLTVEGKKKKRMSSHEWLEAWEH